MDNAIKLKLANVRRASLKLGAIAAGNLLIAFAIINLVLRNEFACGGVSGIGNVLNLYLGIPVSFAVAVINVILFAAGYFFIGREFALNTLASSVIFPVFLRLFEKHVITVSLLGFSFAQSLIAGGMIGIGLGIIIRAGGSTGGVDIIALIMNKKINIPVHIMLYITDFTILILQFPMNVPVKMFWGVITIMTTSFVLKKTLALHSEK